MTTPLAILFNQRHLLPTGRMPLRILPGTQMDTVSYAINHNIRLGLCMEDAPCERGNIGTTIRIEDFYSTDHDGILTIQVCGQERFLVDALDTAMPNIVLANTHVLPSWPEQPIDSDAATILSERLQSMFDRYPELSSLHKKPNFDSLTWLCQRWLELLPLPTSEKQLLMAPNSCSQAAQYLLSLMKDPH